MQSSSEKGKAQSRLKLDKPLTELTPAEQKNFLRSIKKIVFEQEKDNLSHIFFYYTGSGWYKAGGNSALFLHHIIAPTNKDFNPRLRPDGDFNDKFVTGVLSFRDISKVGDIVTEFGAERDDTLSQGNFIIAYKLQKTITAPQLRKVLGVEDMKRTELNETLSLAQSDPGLAALIRKLQKSTLSTVHAMRPIDRELIGSRLIDANMQLLSEYRNWANGGTDKRAGLEAILCVLDKITDYMLVVLENEIIELDKVADFTFQIESIRATVKKRIAFLDKVAVD